MSDTFDDTNIKMYCIVSEEAFPDSLKHSGKLAAQAGHAFLGCFNNILKYDYDLAMDYIQCPLHRKIVVTVSSTQKLLNLYEKYKDKNFAYLVVDEGLTHFNGQTVTCLGLAVFPCDNLKDISRLRLL